jgi:transitional endoplasmic reticulum ATPase
VWRIGPHLTVSQKRPSRFDRKYYFPNPNLKERTAYCKFWQRKLSDNKDIEFPDKLCKAIAEITDKFSFAYMQEAFVASLLAIARRSHTNSLNRSLRDRIWTEDLSDDWVGVVGGGGDGDQDELEKLPLWVEIKKQIAILREGIDSGSSA